MNPEDAPILDTTESVDASIDGVYVFPAGLEQSRYWLLDQLAGASTASNMAVAFRLEGPIEDDAAEQAVRALVLRHEALRTTFRMVEATLSQVISEEVAYEFSVSDLRALPAADRQDRAEELIHEHSRIQVDLANGPALFVRLIHVSDVDHFLAFTVHHIACDGWSNGVLIRDFTLFYVAAVEKREPSLPPLPFQFADFTVWQQSWLESEAAQAALAFWKEHLRREMPAIDLPTDHPRTAQKSAPGNIEGQLLSPELTVRLKAYCRQHDATMHQVLLAAFEALITRYTGQAEFLLGSTIANRTQPDMENVVGRFAHPQVILADVHGNPSYRELLGRVIDWSAKSYAHQDLPFSRLAEQFQLHQAGATSQFLQVYFVYQKAFMQPQTAGALRIIPRPSVSGGVDFDMLVGIVERNEGPRLQIEYNTLLFERERVIRLLDQYTRVLEAVMDDDTLTVSALPLVSDEEQSALKSAATASPASTGGEQAACAAIAQVFDSHAVALRESPALIVDVARTSWNELRARSLSLARAMQHRGLHPGQTVAVRIEPSADSAAAVLGALRLGLVVLPVPVGVGTAEWQKIQTELKPAICLGDASFAAKASSITAFAQLETASREPDSPCSGLPHVDASSTAWLSTTNRNDVSYEYKSVSHAATVASVTKIAQAFAIKVGDATFVSPSSENTPLAAVDAWTDLLLPLLSGATVVYPNVRKPEPFRSVIDREQVSFALGKAAEWSQMLQDWPGDRRLNLICRGSRLSPAVAARLAKSNCRVWSLVSSAATAGPFALAKIQAGPEASPLAPLPGETLRIVDGAGAAVPFGVPGELVVERDGVQLQPGYTARYSPTRGFELTGKLDRLVSLHGYRLHLEELEDILLAESSIATAEAAIVADTTGKPVLAAWITGHDGQPPSASAVRTHLKSSAPPHFASTEILPVSAIPHRLDGSADLALVPVPGSLPQQATEDAGYVPPRDELEKNLVFIWETVLGVRPIGIRTSFFALGGYSLMIVRLFANINRSLSLSLPITTIFNAPTIEQLADVVRGRTLYSPLVPVQPKGEKPPFFLIHSYLLYGGLPKVLGDDQPFYGLRELNQSMTMPERVASYAKEVRAVQPKGPYYIGGWCAAGPLAVETARNLIESGEQVGMIFLFDSWRPGYAAELAETQKHMPEMALPARLYRKYRYHRGKLQPLTAGGRAKYAGNALKQKVLSMRSRLYLKNWAMAQRLFQLLGLPLPAFMHNVSLQTFESIRSYSGKPLSAWITLIRATDAVYVPGAEPGCGWGVLAEKGIDVHWASGNHETMFVEPNLSVVGEIVRESLKKAQSPTPETNA